jgi:hypothetical protein
MAHCMLLWQEPLPEVPPSPPSFPTPCCLLYPGLARLGQQDLVTRVLDFDEMLPAACQGAIGVTCSASDPFIRW